MAETSTIQGHDLAPPPTVPDAWWASMERIIAILMDGQETPEEWAQDQSAQDALAEARSWAERWQKRATNCKLVLERVSQPSAHGPGRSVRMFASWNERTTGAEGTRMAYPPLHQDTDKMIHSVRHLLEHVVRN